MIHYIKLESKIYIEDINSVKFIWNYLYSVKFIWNYLY